MNATKEELRQALVDARSTLVNLSLDNNTGVGRQLHEAAKRIDNVLCDREFVKKEEEKRQLVGLPQGKNSNLKCVGTTEILL